MILALETSCDDTCAAVVTATARCGRTRSPRRACCTPATAEWCPRWRRAATSSSSTRSRPTRSRRAGVDAGGRRARGRHPRPGPDRRPARGRVVARRRWPPRASCHWRRSTTCTGTWWPARLAPDPIEPPVPLPRGERGPYLHRASGRPTVVHRARPDARRRGRRGVRQGGADARACPTRAAPSSTGWRATATPDAFAFPRVGSRRRARLQLQRAQDRAAVRHPRPRRAGGRAAPRRPGGVLSARDRRGAHRPRRAGDRARAGTSGWRIGGGVAANSELRRSLADLCADLGVRLYTPTSRAVHGQRGDDRGRRPLHGPDRRTRDYLSLDAVGEARAMNADPLRKSRAATCATTRGQALAEVAGRFRVRPSRRSTSPLDPRLHHRYGERIPVLDVDGDEALELGFDAAAAAGAAR